MSSLTLPATETRPLHSKKTPRAYRAMDQNNTAPNNTEGKEVLVVASKVKKYIKEKSGGMNTSSTVMDALSEKVRVLCDQAIERAKADGRKTVMDRDF